MIKFNYLIFILFIVTLGVVSGETYQSYCYIKTVDSQNDDYYLHTIPYDNIGETTIGVTKIFNSDSVLKYEIDRHFNLAENRRELFLSNDGNTVAYVISYEFNYDGQKSKSIEIYKKGKLFKQYSLSDLIECDYDYEDCYLFYNEAIDSVTWEDETPIITYKNNITEFEKRLSEKATFLINDTLYIFTKTKELISIDLETSDKTTLPFEKVNFEKFSNIKIDTIISTLFKTNSSNIEIELISGETLGSKIAELFDMALVTNRGKNTRQYKQYSFTVHVCIDKKGNAVLEKILNFSSLPELEIKNYIEANLFKHNLVPKATEKWVFRDLISLRNKDEEEAIKERQIELDKIKERKKNNLVADTINGVYIPKNLEECFIQLNKLLKPKDVDEIKNLENRSETIRYHHGFGTWLRNHWGLWGGSRLEQYLKNKNLDHPDFMSSTILQFYYDWLNDNHEDWQKFEANE